MIIHNVEYAWENTENVAKLRKFELTFRDVIGKRIRNHAEKFRDIKQVVDWLHDGTSGVFLVHWWLFLGHFLLLLFSAFDQFHGQLLNERRSNDVPRNKALFHLNRYTWLELIKKIMFQAISLPLNRTLIRLINWNNILLSLSAPRNRWGKKFYPSHNSVSTWLCAKKLFSC